MASPKKKPPEPPPFHPEPSLAEQAFLALEAELLAQRDPAVTRVAIDVQRASAVAHSVMVRDEAPERAAMFARLETVVRAKGARAKVEVSRAHRERRKRMT